jgi:flagellar biosynthesis protein FliP
MLARDPKNRGDPGCGCRLRGFEMPTHGLFVNELSRVISQATAPAFLLGAVAAFVSVLIGRLNRIVDRSNALEAIEDSDPAKGRLKESIPRLRRRALLISRAIQFAIMSGVFTTLLVIIAFVSTALGFNQAYGAAVLFVLALSFFAAALISLWFEVRIAVAGLDGFL